MTKLTEVELAEKLNIHIQKIQSKLGVLKEGGNTGSISEISKHTKVIELTKELIKLITKRG